MFRSDNWSYERLVVCVFDGHDALLTHLDVEESRHLRRMYLPL